MRVGLVVPGFSADASDWCIPALRHFARALVARDDVRVIAVRYPYRAGRYAIDGADVLAIGGAARRGLGTPRVWRRVLEALRSEHRRCPFDVLHAFWATESGLLASTAGRVLGIPTVISLAGGELVALPAIGYGDQRVAWERLKIRATLGLASAVTAGSYQLVDMARHHVPRERLHRAPLGVDFELFTPAPVNSPSSSVGPKPVAFPTAVTTPDSSTRSTTDAHAPRLVHVATLTRVKDQATLLRAFAILRQRLRYATLLIVGDGPLRDELEVRASNLGIADAVEFRGDVDHAALPALYRTSSAFVLSSRHEAQGMVAIEAAACGVPVVGTRVGVIPELAASPAGVASVAAAGALAEALAAAVGSASDSRHASQQARELREHFRAEFGLEQCVARFRALYSLVAPT